MADNVKGSRYIATLNNPFDHGVESPQEWLEHFYTRSKAVYLNGQVERGAEGTLHLQYFVSFKDPVRITALKKLCPHSHFTVVKKDNGASEYCLKEDTRVDGPWEFGKKPLKRNDPKDWSLIKEEAKKGNLDAVPDDVYVRHYHTLKAIAKDHMVPVKRTSPRVCFWYWGATGMGKSREAFN